MANIGMLTFWMPKKDLTMIRSLHLSALRSFVVPAVTAVAILAASSAQAADPKVLGTFGDWTAYSFKETSGTVCYMASQPKKAKGDYTSRGDIFALITHRPGEKTRDVVSLVIGYPFKDESDATITIDKATYKLFTKGERAWARDTKTDAEIAASIRRGSGMVVKGISSRGTETTDTYSLRGSNDAYAAISKECGLKVD